MNIKQIREGLRQCLILKECSSCPYYIYYYNDDVEKLGDNSCWGKLQRDADEALLRLEILVDEED